MYQSQELRDLPLEQIEPNLSQPRRCFDEATLQVLADSVSERGVLQPVLVRPLQDGRYGLIAGERRWPATHPAPRRRQSPRALVLVWVSAYRAPALEGDAQDHDGHAQADEWIEDRSTYGNGDGAGDHGERDVCVDAGVIAVCDQRGAVQVVPSAGANLRGEPVAREPDRAGEREDE